MEVKMNWTDIWMRLFGTTTFLGLDMGFWVSMGIVAFIVLVMNVVFWGMKPGKQTGDSGKIDAKPPQTGYNRTRSI